jgi:mitosis inhibitor protein kinase SWE1
MPTEENVGFRTPVTQLFGDEKPSPAAFASTGLVKKRGSKFAIPRFQDVIKARNWSPVNANADTPSKSSSQTSSQTQRDEPEDEFEDTDSPLRPLRTAPFGRTSSHTRIPSAASDKWPGHVRIPSTASEKWSGHARVPSTASIGSRGLRRKNSAMFNSNGSIGDSMSDRGSPATPTKSLPFAASESCNVDGTDSPVQKFGLSTPSPSSSYPFDRRNSIDSPVCTPMPKNKMGRIRALSRGGPIHRASNPMLSTAFRSQEVVPSTPVDTVLEDFTALSANSSMGPFERDYTLIASLGHGEFSHVWKVRHKEDGEHCAIKMGRVFASSRNRQRQLEEVAILRRLSSDGHPNILKFIDSWEQSSRLYIRTELSECGDLAQYLASVGDVGGVGEGRVWKMLAELTSALGFIHSHHVLHLDLKPSNILLSNGGSLKIGDFGMSVFRHDEMEDNYDNDMYGPRGSRARSRFDSDCEEGDRDYLSPEGLKGRPGFEADVYSLGILVLEAALNIALPTSEL